MIIGNTQNKQEQVSYDFCIDEVYRKHKDSFYSWAKFNFQLSEEEVKDVYQDTIIGFYQNIATGRLEEIKFTTKTYLFAIGKNLILNKIKYNRRFDKIEANFDIQSKYEMDNLVSVKESAREFIENKIEELGEPCKTILKLYYYAGYSLESIKREINSKNPNVVKAQKSRCMKVLKGLIKEKYKITDFFDS